MTAINEETQEPLHIDVKDLTFGYPGREVRISLLSFLLPLHLDLTTLFLMLKPFSFVLTPPRTLLGNQNVRLFTLN